MRGGRGRTIVLNVALLLGSLAFSIVAAEVVLRVFFEERFHPMVPSGERGLFWEYDARLGWRHQPGAIGRFEKPGVFDTQVAINSHGFRDRMRSIEPEPGVRRIVVLGDSISWGYGVEAHQMFTEILERAVRGLEVINLAVSGYGTDQESLLLESTGMKFRPDLVLLEVCHNDFGEISRDQVFHIYPKPRYVLRDGELELTNVPVPRVSAFDGTLFRLRTGSYLWRAIESTGAGSSAIEGLSALARGAGLSLSAEPSDADETRPEELILALIRRIRATAESGGARLALFVVAPMRPDHRQMILRFAEEEGIPILDLKNIFEASLATPGTPPVFLPNDLHWTPAGHRIVAGAMFEWLIRGGVLLGQDRAADSPSPQND